MKKNLFNRIRLGPSAVIALGFAVLILVGTLLLMLPISSEDGRSEAFLTCVFTATSASCVTGLILVDTASNWSFFGESVIISMIQIGGLGFMTMAILLSLLIKRRISPKERQLVAQSFNLSSYGGIVKLTKKIIRGTFILEGIGALVLATRFVPMFGWIRGVWKATFTSISAFCNAGFDLMGKDFGEFSSLTEHWDDPVINITVMFLIVTGGIGFVVWDDIYKLIFEKKKLSLYSQMILITSAILLFGGAFVFLCLECNNPGTLGEMPWGGKILASFFQSVTARTAGFNTVDLCSMMPVTKIVFILLMFIGGCSGSTAGGVKVGTVAVVFMCVLNALAGRSDVVIFKRKISDNNVRRALAVVVLQFAVTMLGAIVIIGGGAGVMDAMFEAFSASGTVGVTLSLTGSLNLWGKLTIIILMYFGRVGILTVSFAVMSKLSESKKEYRKAEANVMVG